MWNIILYEILIICNKHMIVMRNIWKILGFTI